MYASFSAWYGKFHIYVISIKLNEDELVAGGKIPGN